MIFPHLCIFLRTVIAIINPLISDDGDFVCLSCNIRNATCPEDEAAFL